MTTTINMARKHKYLFSLIELLVIVAIIGILASILLPVLGKARKKSRLAICTSNSKQISLAIYMYTEDQDDYFPFSSEHNNTSWDDRLGSMEYDGRSITAEQVDNKSKLTDASIYECPASEVELTNQNNQKRSYSLNYGKAHKPSQFRGIGTGSWSMKSNEVNEASQSIMITENNKPGNYLGNNNNDFTNNNFIKAFYDTPDFWTHKYSQLNLSMVDGSVRILSMQHTYLGLRDATASGNQINTMWDCQD